MNNKVIHALIFATGAAVGSVATWQILQKRYERIVKEEIDDVKEKYSKVKEELDEAHAIMEENEQIDNETVEQLMQYKNIAKEQGYTDYEAYKENPVIDKPYLIPPEECGEFDDYQIIGMTYFSDGTLVDDNGDLVEDIEGTVGVENLSRFGEYEDDAIHVRNDRLKCDYEVVRDQKTYDEMLESAPYKADVE